MFKGTTIWFLWLALAGPGESAAVRERPPEHPATLPPQYAVIVNSKNPFAKTGQAARSTVKQLFLKDLTQWPSGKMAKPYARRASSNEQSVFQNSLLGMKDAEIARHWLKVKNMNGLTPPKAVGSDRLLLKFVARHEGAFGVVRRSAIKSNAKVRVLFTL